MLGVRERLNGTPEHTPVEVPTVSAGIGLIITCKVSFAALQGPIGSFVVKIKFTLPAEISAELGE